MYRRWPKLRTATTDVLAMVYCEILAIPFWTGLQASTLPNIVFLKRVCAHFAPVLA